MARKKTITPSVVSTDLGNGFVRLTASNGSLYSIVLGRIVPVAVVKPENAKHFKAV